MTIRVKKRQRYTVVDNALLENTSLSFKAKGILVYLLSKPDDWVIYMQDIISQSTDGRDAISAGVKELEQAGYIQRKRQKGGDNKFIGWEYVVYEFPITDYPKSDFPITAFPITENPQLLSTELTKELSNDNSLVQHLLDGADENGIDLNEAFDKAYAKYPRHEGKAKGKQLYMSYLKGRDIKGQGKVKFNHYQMSVAIQAFAEAMQGRDTDKIKLLNTFMGTDVIDYVEKTKQAYAEAMQGKYGDNWQTIKFCYKEGKC